MTAESDADRRIGFLIAGVQKGGTSSLYAMLARHPQVARSERKELHFFDRDRRDWSTSDYSDYHERFIWSESSVIAGEATPSYVFWPGAMERARAYNPDLRVVLSFRDPVERAFSQWCMERGRRDDTIEFGDAIRAVCPPRWPRTPSEAGRPYRAFVGRGYYGEQLANVLELFPAEQVLSLDYHTMFKHLPAALDQITDLIGVERFKTAPPPVHRRATPTALGASPPSEDDVKLLADLYAEDLAAFGELSGIDVSGWPTTRVAAGTLAAADLAESLAAKVTFRQEIPEDAVVLRDRARARRKARRAKRAEGRSSGRR